MDNTESNVNEGASTVQVDKHAVVTAAKLLNLAHQKGLFTLFPPVEAMKHLSVLVYLESVLSKPKDV